MIKIKDSEWDNIPKTKTFNRKRYTHYICVAGTAAGKRFMIKGTKEMKDEDKTLLTRIVKIGNLYCLYTAKK